jgi:hypothetical protein
MTSTLTLNHYPSCGRASLSPMRLSTIGDEACNGNRGLGVVIIETFPAMSSGGTCHWAARRSPGLMTRNCSYSHAHSGMVTLAEPRATDVVRGVHGGIRRQATVTAYRRVGAKWQAHVEYKDAPGVSEWVNQDHLHFNYDAGRIRKPGRWTTSADVLTGEQAGGPATVASLTTNSSLTMWTGQ